MTDAEVVALAHAGAFALLFALYGAAKLAFVRRRRRPRPQRRGGARDAKREPQLAVVEPRPRHR